MKKPSDALERREQLRQNIIGLGEKSLRKSYYPELQKQLRQLEEANKKLSKEIQERKEAEAIRSQLESHLRQVQKLEAIGSLSGGIAHDFNNILSIIIGYAELAKQHIQQTCEHSPCPAEGDLDGVLKSAERAKQLVRRILTFSRQQEGAPQPVELDHLIEDTTRMLRAVIPATISIVHRCQTRSTSVMADPTQLHQVLMNLGTNAYQAMRREGGTLRFELSEREISAGDRDFAELQLAPGPYLLLQVCDTGCGMDRKTQSRIFDPYFTTKAGEGGTGLGLSVVHGILATHRGHISVFSEPGKGTTFYVYLPKLHSERDIHRPIAATGVTGGSEHLLVVDDEPALTDILQRLLESAGYTVTPTNSPLEASKLFTHAPNRFDLVITDMNMPEVNGTELIRRLREIRADIPIILFTGFSEQMNPQAMETLGCARHLMKPVVKSELCRTIRSLLDARMA